MNKSQLRMMCQKQVDDCIDRMHELCYDGRSEDAKALYSEIQEWISMTDDIEVYSLDYIDGMFHND